MPAVRQRLSQVLHVKNNIHTVHRHRTARKGTGPLSNVFNACRQTSSPDPIPPHRPTPRTRNPFSYAQLSLGGHNPTSFRGALQKGAACPRPLAREKKKAANPYVAALSSLQAFSTWHQETATMQGGRRHLCRVKAKPRARVVNGPCAPLLYRLRKLSVGRP